jgi:hypothetical protein
MLLVGFGYFKCNILYEYLLKQMSPDQGYMCLKVVGNEKVWGSGMCQSVPIRLGPRRWRCVSLSILLLPLILSISVSAPVKQNE